MNISAEKAAAAAAAAYVYVMYNKCHISFVFFSSYTVQRLVFCSDCEIILRKQPCKPLRLSHHISETTNGPHRPTVCLCEPAVKRLGICVSSRNGHVEKTERLHPA